MRWDDTKPAITNKSTDVILVYSGGGVLVGSIPPQETRGFDLRLVAEFDNMINGSFRKEVYISPH